MCHWKKTFWVGGCDGIGGLAYLLFCSAYWSRQPRVFQRLSRSCLILSHFFSTCCHQTCKILLTDWLAICKIILYPLHNEVVGGYIGFTPSVHPSVCPSDHPASRVCSVAPTVLVGSISYLYILSSNCRWCVEWKVFCNILKFEFLTFFLNL